MFTTIKYLMIYGNTSTSVVSAPAKHCNEMYGSDLFFLIERKFHTLHFLSATVLFHDCFNVKMSGRAKARS